VRLAFIRRAAAGATSFKSQAVSRSAGKSSNLMFLLESDLPACSVLATTVTLARRICPV
jgi:hypothetical protein